MARVPGCLLGTAGSTWARLVGSSPASLARAFGSALSFAAPTCPVTTHASSHSFLSFSAARTRLEVPQNQEADPKMPVEGLLALLSVTQLANHQDQTRGPESS